MSGPRRSIHATTGSFGTTAPRPRLLGVGAAASSPAVSGPATVNASFPNYRFRVDSISGDGDPDDDLGWKGLVSESIRDREDATGPSLPGNGPGVDGRHYRVAGMERLGEIALGDGGPGASSSRESQLQQSRNPLAQGGYSGSRDTGMGPRASSSSALSGQLIHKASPTKTAVGPQRSPCQQGSVLSISAPPTKTETTTDPETTGGQHAAADYETRGRYAQEALKVSSATKASGASRLDSQNARGSLLEGPPESSFDPNWRQSEATAPPAASSSAIQPSIVSSASLDGIPEGSDTASASSPRESLAANKATRLLGPPGGQPAAAPSGQSHPNKVNVAASAPLAASKDANSPPARGKKRRDGSRKSGGEEGLEIRQVQNETCCTHTDVGEHQRTSDGVLRLENGTQTDPMPMCHSGEGWVNLDPVRRQIGLVPPGGGVFTDTGLRNLMSMIGDLDAEYRRAQRRQKLSALRILDLVIERIRMNRQREAYFVIENKRYIGLISDVQSTEQHN